MRRRDFLAASAITGLLPALEGQAQLSAPPLLKPRALREGDTVGLIAPSSLVADPDDLITAERTARFFGLVPEPGRTAGRRYATHEESVRERLEDLHAMFADPAVRGIFAVAGGYGAGHLLDRIDYELIRNNPKVFVGYSDITALHLAIRKRTGLVTFHGPVMLSRFSEFTQRAFRKALFSAEPPGALTNPGDPDALRPAHPLRTIRPGKATGPLAGGNLTLISTTMGTPFEIETRGRILLLEDVGEQPYSIDRMLTQLRLAGKLDEAAGLVFGECTECGPREFRPSRASIFTLGETLDNLLKPLEIPVLAGLTIGHTANQLTVPLGVPATLDADAGTLTVLEAGVRA